MVGTPFSPGVNDVVVMCNPLGSLAVTVVDAGAELTDPPEGLRAWAVAVSVTEPLTTSACVMV